MVGEYMFNRLFSFSAFRRFCTGSSLMMIGLIFTVAFTQIDLDSKTFLAITLSVVVILNVGGALAQGSMLGVVAALPPRIIKALMEGQASTGIIAAVANIIVISTTPNLQLVGCIFFSVAFVFVILALILWTKLRKNKYFLHYWEDNIEEIDEPAKELQAQDSRDDNDVEISEAPPTKHICTVMREIVSPGLCVFFTFFVSLALWPSVFALVRPTHYDPDDPWTATYFTPVIVFLVFAICDFLGRMLGGLIRWPTPKQSWLFALLVALRFALIPITMFCNEQPRSRIPVLLHGDAWLICLVIITGLTNGYFVSLGVIHGPSYVAPERKEISGIAMGIYMAMGLSLGVAASFGLVAAL